jgi:hypothetical protein
MNQDCLDRLQKDMAPALRGFGKTNMVIAAMLYKMVGCAETEQERNFLIYIIKYAYRGDAYDSTGID